MTTPGYARIHQGDIERQRAEWKRLLYIAATRAREWLVISRWRPILESSAGTIEDQLPETILGLLESHAAPDRFPDLVRVEHFAPGPAAPRPPAAEDDDRGTPDFEEQLVRISERSRRAGTSGSLDLRRAGGDSHSGPEDVPEIDRESEGDGGVAARIGSAVHSALEFVVSGGGSVSEVVSHVTSVSGLGPSHLSRIDEMVRRALASPLLARDDGRRRLCEVPVLFRSPVDRALVEGKIDLLLEESPGEWTIVDYKTDRIDAMSEEAVRLHFSQYSDQLREYRTALEVLDLRVRRTLILSARNGRDYDFTASPPAAEDLAPRTRS